MKWFFLLTLMFVAGCGGGGGGSSGGEVLSSATIGAEGGTVTTSDAKVTLDIPTGALTESTTITINKTGEKGVVGDVYEFGPSGLSFSQPVTVTISYDPASLLAGATEDNLLLAGVDDYLEMLSNIHVDTVNHKISGKIKHFSQIAICKLEDTGVKVSDFNIAAEDFRIPIGDDGNGQDLGEDLTLLDNTSKWTNFSYPKISFNINGASNNRWYVATAFNQDRWLNNGWAEPSLEENDTYGCNSKLSSIYSCKGSFHTGEDWNLVGVEDSGKPSHAMANGIVLFNQSQQKRDSVAESWKSADFGNIVIIGHKLSSGEIIASVYAHMKAESDYKPKMPVSKGNKIGNIGDSGAAEGAPHLHFEIAKSNNTFLKIDGGGSIKIPVCDTETMKKGWHWPGKDSKFINENYYDPSNFIKEHSADITPPVISSISANNITNSSATIIWTTNERATSQVEYGTTTSYGSSTSLSSTFFTSRGRTISGLQPSTTYHFRVKSADASGNLAVSGDNIFTTMPITDTTPPAVSSTSPANGAIGVPINSSISAAFSEVMDASTITAATFTVSGVSGTVVYSGTTATFTPSANLASSITYTATITIGAKDLAGNSIASSYVWSFTTGTSTDAVLTVTKQGTGSGTVTSSPAGINCGADCTELYDSGTSVTLTATPDVGSVFSGWSGGGCTGTGTCTVIMSANSTVTATFSLVPPPTLAVTKSGTGSGTVTSSPAGINCGVDCSEAYASGTLVTLTATADIGSTFSSWSGDADCSDGQITMNASKTCTATFNPDTVQILASGLIAPHGIAGDISDIFWIELPAPDGRIGRVSKNGDNQTSLASGLLTNAVPEPHLALDDFDIYFVEGLTKVMKISKSGGPPVTILDLINFPDFASLFNINNITVDGTNIYLKIDDQIIKFPKAGGQPVLLAAPPSSFIVDFSPGLAVDGTHVYWSDASVGEIGKIAIDGSDGQVITTLASGLNNPGHIVLDSTHVYWIEETGGVLRKVPKNGGTIITLLSGLTNPHALTVDDTHVYWTEGDLLDILGSGAIKKMPKDGGSPVTVASGINGPNDIIVDAASIYWTETVVELLGGVVKKAPK